MATKQVSTRRRERDDEKAMDKFVRKRTRDENNGENSQNETMWFEKIKEEILSVIREIVEEKNGRNR